MRSNSKEVKTKIQKHILGFINPKDYGVRYKASALEKDVNAVKFGRNATNYNAGRRLAQGGNFLIASDDIDKFIKSLNINPKNKKFSQEETQKLYEHLVGREVETILKPKKSKKGR